MPNSNFSSSNEPLIYFSATFRPHILIKDDIKMSNLTHAPKTGSKKILKLLCIRIKAYIMRTNGQI